MDKAEKKNITILIVDKNIKGTMDGKKSLELIQTG